MDDLITSMSQFLIKVPLALLVFAPLHVSARLEWPASLTDLTEYSHAAPIIFRGRVLSVAPGRGYDSRLAVARFQVDRWYRKPGMAEVEIYFAPYRDPGMTNGHACIDFKTESYWLVFAKEINGHLTPFDDCNGALPVSARVGPIMQEAAMSTQMEADFLAGLEDVDQDARLFSIQRLGGLGLSSSRPSLHRVIEMGSPTEVKWAVYAALHTGDTSVLPQVRQMLTRADFDLPVQVLGAELCHLKEHSRSDSAELVGIANTAVHPVSRECSLSALASIKSHESLPTLASHLLDPDARVRYGALVGMGIITRESSCTIPATPTPTTEMIDRQARRCLGWWRKVGSRDLPRR
jgi:hypothetical protein